MIPHVIESIGKDDTKCIVCGVVWKALTERDKVYLSTQGQCHGTDDIWHLCMYTGRHCRGQKGHEECVPLKNTLHWSAQELKSYLKPVPRPE